MIKIVIDEYHSSTTMSCFISFTFCMKLYNSMVVLENQ